MSKKSLGVGLTVAAVMVAGAIGAASGSAAPTAGAAVALTSCDISGKERDLGASYVTSLKVASVSCAKGEKTIKAYHACRKAKGGGVCGNPGKGWSCKEGKRVGVPDVQYSATVKCRKGASKRVKSRYTQNT
ncbi:MAG: hypothetical protein ACXWZ6_05675 [Solirubrobacterales bacterium]